MSDRTKAFFGWLFLGGMCAQGVMLAREGHTIGYIGAVMFGLLFVGFAPSILRPRPR